MPTLTIKKFPEPLLESLRREASAARRSLTQEVLMRLENSLKVNLPDLDSAANRQAEAWENLSGKWQSDLTLREEIDELYRARTQGKDIVL